MSLDLQHLLNLRPYLYHLTARSNIEHIRADQRLKPANKIFAESGNMEVARELRRGPRRVSVNNRIIHIRDQDRLHGGNITFRGGWNIFDLVYHLNEHVFFWPGWENGPIKSGQNHFERYSNERPEPVVLKIPFADLLRENPKALPLVCRFNSGAPSCHAGKGVPRGPETFATLTAFRDPPSAVKEITFRCELQLPGSTVVRSLNHKHWVSLAELKL